MSDITSEADGDELGFTHEQHVGPLPTTEAGVGQDLRTITIGAVTRMAEKLINQATPAYTTHERITDADSYCFPIPRSFG